MNGFTKNRSFSRLTYRLWKALSLIYQLLVCFLAEGLSIFPQALATDLPYVTFRFTWQTLQTSLQLVSFWTGFISFSHRPTVFKFFSRKTTKTRNTRMLWRLQILSRKKRRDSDWIILTARHSTVEWVFAWLIRGWNKENNSVLPSPIFSRSTRWSFLFPSLSDACHPCYVNSGLTHLACFTSVNLT